MMKLIFLIAGMLSASYLPAGKIARVIPARAGKNTGWAVFVDKKGLVWSVPESELWEYNEMQANERVFAFYEIGAALRNHVKPAGNYILWSGLEMSVFCGCKRSRRRPRHFKNNGNYNSKNPGGNPA